MLDFDAITHAAVAVLADLGGRPIALSELAIVVGEQLGLEVVTHDPADPWDEDAFSADLLDELLLETDDVLYLADDRVAHRAGLLDGLVLTRRVTRGELDAGELELGPDLLPLLTINERDGIAVVGGGTARVRTPNARAEEEGLAVGAFDDDPEARARAWRLSLPAGALDGIAPGSLVGVQLVDGALAVLGEVEADAEATAHAAATLRSTLELWWEPDEPVEGGQLVAHASVEDPTVLRSACEPLSELYDQAGLDTYGDWVAPDGFDWDAWRDARADAGELWRIQQRHDLTFEDAQVVLAVVDAAQLFVEGHEQARAPELLGALGGAIAEPPLAMATYVELALPEGTQLDPLLDPDEVEAFLTAVLDATEQIVGEELAGGARYGLALLAERDGDPDRAQRLLRQVLAIDPEFRLAIWDLAQFAADAGDAAKARGYLRQLQELGVELPDDDPFVAAVETRARPGPTSAGRNDPCPCGSGRKHKVCCGPRNGWPLTERVDWLLGRLVSYSRRPHATDVSDTIVAAAIADDPYGAASDVDGLLALFVAIFDAGLVDDAHRERGLLLPADELEMLAAWRDVRVGWYEVVDVTPGDGLELLDLTSGERVEVRERTASHQLKTGDQLLAHVVPVPGDRSQLAGSARVVAGHERASLGQVVGKLQGDTDPIELARWLRAAAAPPHLTNTEGHELVHHTLVWEVEDPVAADMALTRAYGEPDVLDGDQVDEGVGGEGQADGGQGGDVAWVAYVDDDPEGYVRAHLTLSGSRLTVEVNSVERAEVVRAWVAEHLDGAQLVDETIEPFDASAAVRAARAAARDPRGAEASASGVAGSGVAGPDPFADLDDEEREQLRAALDQMMVGYEQRWVDEPVPALGGLTPRQALDDPTRRDDVIRLIDEMDEASASMATGSGQVSLGGAMNADRVRRLLGLASERPSS